MKRKLLLCLQTMVIGGVEKELITILRKFDKSKYDITLLLFYISDESIIKEIPKEVRISVLNIERAYYFGGINQIVASRFAKGRIIEGITLAGKTLLNGGASSAFINISKLPAPSEVYDVAVCYHMHSGLCLRYVAELIKANKKICWIHNDFSTTGYKIKNYVLDLKNYALFVSVSERLREEFISIVPEFRDNAITLHNIVDEEEILKKATEDTDEDFKNDTRIKIVTVGRYVEQKGYDLAISACRQLLDQEYDVAWYAIGYGAEEEKMRQQVLKLGLV